MGSGNAAALSRNSERHSEPARIADSLRMRAPIETLLFDFGGTLDADGVAWKERFYALYRAEGLAMTAAAFQSSFFAADDALVGSLAPATDLAGTVDALVGNLETELGRRPAGTGKPEIDGDR